VSSFVRRKIWPKFPVTAFSQNFGVQVTRTRELLHVAAITLVIPFKLGESNIVGFQRKEPEAIPDAGVHRHYPLVVVFRRRGKVRHCAQEVDIAGRASLRSIR
jgi:hypothetical protein